MTDALQELAQAAHAAGREKLSLHPLCDACLGRRFAGIGRGMLNAHRGLLARQALGMPEPSGECWVCEGLTAEYEEMAGAVVEALKPFEFSNFLMGTRTDPLMDAREDELSRETGLVNGEPFKSEINREVGKLVAARTGWIPEFAKPDIVAILDARFFSVKVESNPVYLMGRYLKFERGIPQTRWPCRSCRGKGCDRCGGTGKMYQTSVEELVGGPALAAFGAKEHLFHGMGREDIDARMLGTGRPFILELKEPVKRMVDLSVLQAAINSSAAGRVEVRELAPTVRDDVARYKEAKHDKTYVVEVSISAPVEEKALGEALAGLVGGIDQRTPVRVSHRRADLVRSRSVRSAQVDSFDGQHAKLTIVAETGTYIKELLHGDEGRTTPSLAGLLGLTVKVDSLDVVDVKYPAQVG